MLYVRYGAVVPEIDPLGRSEFTYLQIADVIAQRIKAGRYAYQLPGERALAVEFGVAYETQRQAMKVLRQRGLIVTRQGRGTFLAHGVTPARDSSTTDQPEPDAARQAICDQLSSHCYPAPK